MRRTVYLIGLCLVLTIGVYGCGSSKSADSGQVATAAKSAKASFSVTIPQKATKSLIPAATSYVYISWYGYDMTTGSYAPGELYLYPDATGKATGSADLIPGIYNFTAYCYDATGLQLATADTFASVSSGTNDIVITFISGRWTFTTPIVLSQGETLSSVDLAPSISGYGEYPATFNVTDSTGLAITPTPTGYLYYMSISGDLSSLAALYGFPSIPAGSQLDILDMSYDITTGTSNGNWAQGDRIIALSSMGPGEGTGSTSPDISAYFNSKFASGTALTGTLFEFNEGTYSSTPVATPTGLCTMQQPVYKKANARSAALRKAVGTTAVKSAGTAIGTVTLIYTSCDFSYSGGEPFTDTNLNGFYDYGEPFTDTNLNGYYDYGTPTSTEVTATETITNLIVYPFTANGTEL